MKTQSGTELVVCLGHGGEDPTYARAHALWRFYASHFPDISFLFVRDSNELRHGEVRHDGHSLVVGIDANFGVGLHQEHQRMIYRQIAVYEFLLRSRQRPFYVYQSTITSVVDFRGVQAMLELLPDKACYAGMPGRMATPADLEGLTFACGTNGIFSSDLLTLMRDRYVAGHPYADLPQDLWQALVLQDIPRIALPFFSFVTQRSAAQIGPPLAEMTRRLIGGGHYHFRVSTGNDPNDPQARANRDPWIMLEVMKGVLSCTPPAGVFERLQQDLTLSLATKNGKTMAAYGEDNFFTGTRRFPLDDTEAELIYPDLKAPA